MTLLRKKPINEAVEQGADNDLKPTLGAFQLMLMGVGGTIGTGIFVLTSEAAQKAGPGMMFSFLLAGSVCALAALCYAELAAMIPKAGSAYTYTFVAVGELPAWLVGWGLVLEYAISAAAVSVGWSGYVVGALRSWLDIGVPEALSGGPFAGGVVNLPAILVALAAAGLLMLGTRESARVNAVLVIVKLVALGTFAVIALRGMHAANFTPIAPMGWGGGGGAGVLGATASIFFAYVGFDAVSTAAEETRDPQRNVPLGLIGGLAICTLFYMVVSAGVIGSPLGAQPLLDGASHWLAPGSTGLSERCAQFASATAPLPCSTDGLAHVMRVMGYPTVGTLIGLAAMIALPSVVLVLIYGQTRMFLAMARDGLLPARLAAIHPRFKTPQQITAITGATVAIAAGFLPIGKLADIANAGTLFAFTMVSVAVLRMRRTAPDLRRPFRTPAVGLVAIGAIVGCLCLFASLPLEAQLVLPAWSVIGLVIYLNFGHRHSNQARSTN
jgi:APA family basic amino acid/polyamine antiporter